MAGISVILTLTLIAVVDSVVAVVAVARPPLRKDSKSGLSLYWLPANGMAARMARHVL